jgi:nucleotide-binding universal stress UspA family protein
MTALIVATDLSERADRAMGRAFMMAGELGASVTVLSVVDDAMPPRIARVVAAEARDRLASQVATLSQARGVSRRILVDTGQPHRMILRRAAEIDAALIVLGMHRETGFRDYFRGTTVARVARGGVWPVMVVRNYPDHAHRQALIGVDFSDASRSAIRAVRRFAPQASRRLFHAYTVPLKGYLGSLVRGGAGPSMSDARVYDQEVRWQMAAFVKEMGETAMPPIVEEGSFEEVFTEAFESLRPDLVAIGAHGRGGIARELLGSSAEGLLRDPPCDLLVA